MSQTCPCQGRQTGPSEAMSAAGNCPGVPFAGALWVWPGWGACLWVCRAGPGLTGQAVLAPQEVAGLAGGAHLGGLPATCLPAGLGSFGFPDPRQKKPVLQARGAEIRVTVTVTGNHSPSGPRVDTTSLSASGLLLSGLHGPRSEVGVIGPARGLQRQDVLGEPFVEPGPRPLPDLSLLTAELTQPQRPLLAGGGLDPTFGADFLPAVFAEH